MQQSPSWEDDNSSSIQEIPRLLQDLKVHYRAYKNTIQMKAVCSSEMLVSTYKSTRRLNPEYQHRHLNSRENPESHVII
jgi:hypothetical protein